MPNEDNYWLNQAEQWETRKSDQEKEMDLAEYVELKEHEWEAEDER